LELAAVGTAEALARYSALGVSDWAVKQALTDAKSSVRVFETFFKVHRLNCTFTERNLLLVYYSDLWLSGRFIATAKWASSCFLAQMSGVVENGQILFRDLPSRPDWIPPECSPLTALFPSQALVNQKLRTRFGERTSSGTPTKRALNLAWSLLGLKAMFPPMWVDSIGKTLREHAEILGSPPPLSIDSNPFYPTVKVLTVIADSIARLSYGPSVVRYDELPRPRLSSSAGWVKLYDTESKRWRTMRGTRAAQRERLGGSFAEELTSMSYHPRVGVSEYRNIPFQFDWTEWDFSPRVSVVALQEPFKIRTISIADGPATAASSPFQAVWHKTLKSLRPFRLIGGDRVAKVVGDFPFGDGRAFVSGDYSAATDRLSMEASQIVLDRLLRPVALPSELRRRIEVSLLNSELDYSQTLQMFQDKVPESLLESIPLPPQTEQRNGQLMGNILSFPILCMVNLATFVTMVSRSVSHPSYWVVASALERGYFTREEFDALPVLINGDDILFKATVFEYELWNEVVELFGLKPSMGKNYFSEQFFTINSELYTADGFQTRPWWGGFESDFMRLRQELRFETGLDVLHADPRRVLASIQAFLRQSVSERDWPTVNNLWLEHHQRTGVLDYYSGLNWFLPLERGGLGLDPGDRVYHITHAQKCLAVKSAMAPEVMQRYFPKTETSLTSESVRKVYRGSRPTWNVKGEVVDWKGYKLVLDKSVPVRVMFNPRSEKMEMCYSGYPTLESREAKTSHILSWLDYHADGVRFDTSKIPGMVTRLLAWACAISEKHLASFDQSALSPRYLCTTSRFIVPVSDIISS
jgi:hypothetical protein